MCDIGNIWVTWQQMIQDTREIKSITSAVKSAFSKKTIFASSLCLTLRKKLAKSYIRSHGSETLTLWKLNQKYLDSSEIWCWRRMEGTGWTDLARNEEIWRSVKRTGIHSFIVLSVIRQVRNVFQSEFSIDCDLVFPLSISSIVSFP